MLRAVGAALCLFVTSVAAPGWPGGFDPDSATWVVGQHEKDGYPMVVKTIETLPPEPVRKRLPWFMSITWFYDKDARSGLPPEEINDQMVLLESTIDILEKRELCLQVFTKTGNGSKVMIYYVGNQVDFERAFAEVTAEQPSHPLEFDSFRDPDWSDLQLLHRLYLDGQ